MDAKTYLKYENFYRAISVNWFHEMKVQIHQAVSHAFDKKLLLKPGLPNGDTKVVMSLPITLQHETITTIEWLCRDQCLSLPEFILSVKSLSKKFTQKLFFQKFKRQRKKVK